MKRLLLSLLFVVPALSPLSAQTPAPVPEETPHIDLVFCLDATGSMSGLIKTAKEKIWDIVTSLSQTTPAPEIRLGMVFYRDRGDAFVTKVYPLTTDIDSVYSELLDISAKGGGDSPESVNQALHEAVSQMNWSEGAKVYKTIFLVGDCPPHMDYKDDVKYTETCKLASQKGIIINSIKLGLSCTEAVQHFQTISGAAEGEYIQLGQDAGDVVFKTPFDDSINYYTRLIERSRIYYGSREMQYKNYQRKEKSEKIMKEADGYANADRASYNNSKSGAKNFYGESELINDLIEKRVALDSIAEERLPPEIRQLPREKRRAHVDSLVQQRRIMQAHVVRLTQQRTAYIAAERKKQNSTNAFSDQVFAIMQKQAATKGVVLKR
ncbi:MAG: VWA domain-containing protein [Bacteroidetes bacterium]|nr:VWA domain-containing protein [Bacteroidota bacterium]